MGIKSKNLVFSKVLSFTLCALVFHGSQVWSAPETSLRKRIKIRKRSQIQFNQARETQELSLQKIEILNKKRRSLILDIKKFMRSARDGEQKAELNMRLASLYMEDYHAKLAKAQKIYEKQLEKYDKLSARRKKKTPRPKLDKSEALASLKKGRAIYSSLIRRNPKHPRGDEILYFLASTSLDLGRFKESMVYFKKLTLYHPKSKYMSEALIQLGDYYFELSKWKRAEEYYNQLLRRKYKPLLAYTRYKKAWCAYNQHQPKTALKYFKKVIHMEPEEERGSYLQIRNEALRDIALPFVDTKALKESMRFYRKAGAKHQRMGFQNMATLYAEKANHKSAITLWNALLKWDPNHKKNPKYDLNIVESYRLQEQDGKAVDHLFRKLPGYLKTSHWYEINSNNPKIVRGAQEDFEDIARKMAFEIHAKAQKTKSKGHYNLALKLYEAYLQYFPTNNEAPKIRFYLAEILYKRKIYVRAAKEYFKVYKNPQAGKLRLDAIKYALTSLDRQLNIDRKKQGLAEINSKSSVKLKAKMDATLELLPYSNVELSFLKISKEYLKHYKKTTEAPDILYEQSYLRYVHHELKPAYAGFWTFVKTYPKHRSAYSASYLILDILNRTKNYPKLVTAAKLFLRTESLSQKGFRKEVANILRHAELKQVQNLEAEKKYKAAALGYIEYTNAYGAQDEKLYEKALYNAAVNFSKAEMHLRAVETQEKFLRRFPRSKYRKEMLLAVAKAYEMLARFSKAAEHFDLFAKSYPKHPQAKIATRLAGLYYWGNGKNSEAEKVMLRYYASYPSLGDRKIIERDLLDLYASQNSTTKQIQYYRNKRRTRGLPFSQYVSASLKLAELQEDTNPARSQKMAAEALAVARKHRKIIAKSPTGADAMGKLFFWAASDVERRLYRIRLRLPQSRLQANLKKKLALLQNVEKQFKKVAATGSGKWGVGAMYKIAAAYRHMALSVQQAPVPSELAAQQLEQYRAEVKKTIVDPFNEKALTYSVQCLDKSQEFNLLSPWTAKCRSMAGALQPKRYPPYVHFTYLH